MKMLSVEQFFLIYNFMEFALFFEKVYGHYSTMTLHYSSLSGFLGMHRFCLGQTGTAFGKLLTLGGIGVWGGY